MAVDNGEVRAALALPIAGLVSDRPLEDGDAENDAT